MSKEKHLYKDCGDGFNNYFCEIHQKIEHKVFKAIPDSSLSKKECTLCLEHKCPCQQPGPGWAVCPVCIENTSPTQPEMGEWEKGAQKWIDKLDITGMLILNNIVYYRLEKQKESLRKKIEEMKSKDMYHKDKIECNCDCGGPYCNSFMHQCHKPNEHYPQRESAVISIRNSALDDVLKALEE